jgi:serine protease
LVNVWAYDGISKYVLRILPPNTQTLAVASSEEFVAHEMIVQFKKGVANGVKMKAQLGSLATLTHTDTNRPALIKTQPQVVSFANAQGQKASPRSSRALAELQQLNPAIYDQIVTLRNIKAMRLQDGVEYAEPNYRRYAQRVPNDPGYINQWHYSAIGLPQAWDVSTGTKPAGQEVLVAVIDTGVYLNHVDLAGQLIAGYDFIADSQSAGDGNGIDANADDPGDSNQRGQSSWHGTHVAGTIAAASNNNTGAAGVAWGARIMPIRVLGKDGGTSYDVMQGLRYAARLSNDSGTLPARRADIANLSLGGGGGSLAEQNAYAAARATGMIIVAAAGNDSTSSPSYPAAYESVISVSATDFLNQKTSYSNYGSTIDVAAPGGDVTADLSGDGSVDGVLSLLVDDTSGSRKSAYDFYEGTSMAAPHVAGVLALMKTVHPALTPEQVDNLLQAGAITDDLGAVGRDNNFGYGLINALKAVRAATDLAAGAPLPELPPQLRITPASVNLGLSSSVNVTVGNQGGGDPQVTSVTDDSQWLSVSSVTIDGKGLGSYRISANRTGLEDGYYQGQVTFTIDSVQQLTLAVNMQVGSVASAGQLTQMYVLLLDPDTQESVQQAIPVRSGSALNYTFTDVPIGDYTLIAGSDIDVDLYICQSGEVCGAYPSLALRQIISVKGVDLTGVDLVADILGNFSESNAAAQHDPGKAVEANETVGYGVRRLVNP